MPKRHPDITAESPSGKYPLGIPNSCRYSSTMQKRTEEWLRQAEYDMGTADAMVEKGRYIHAVFMCHLAIEKALKGLIYQETGEIPPKSHSLVFLLTRMNIRPPDHVGKFIVMLSEASIPTRYPEDLAKVQRDYTAGVVRDILEQGKGTVAWIKTRLSK